MFGKIKILVLITSFLSICCLFTGCYDAAEPDDQVYTFVIGVDKGVGNSIIVTIQYPTYKSSGGGGGGQSKGGDGSSGESNAMEGVNVDSIEASTILEALDELGTAVSRRISLTHTKALIFSEEFAREGVERYLAPIARFRDTRRVMSVAVVKGKAADFIKANKSDIGDSLAKTMELLAEQTKNNGLFPRVQFHNFYQGMVSTYEQPYAAYAGVNDFTSLEKDAEGSPVLNVEKGHTPGTIPREGVEKREIVGLAVFDGDKMVGTLDSFETRYFLMVTNKFKRGIISIEDKNSPGDAIPLDVRLGRPTKLAGHFEKGMPVIGVKLNIEADIGAIQSRINYEKVDKIGDLESQLKEHILTNVNKLISKVQKQYNSDIFGFGHKLAGYFATIQEWDNYNWLKHFKEAKINVDVEVNIRRTGLIIYSSPVKGTNK